MRKRFVSIWFPYLHTDWHTVRQPRLQQLPFVLTAPDHGRQVIRAVNAVAAQQGLAPGMVLSDARAIVQHLQVEADSPQLNTRLLTSLARWFIRYAPFAAPDPPDGILIDASGCAHLWGDEAAYLRHMQTKMKEAGYTTSTGMASTIGTAWALAHFAGPAAIAASGEEATALAALPPAALRLEKIITERLEKLGLKKIGQFSTMPIPVLHRRFGAALVQRMAQALGQIEEYFIPVETPQPYREHLPCPEPILTATGIQLALEKMLQQLCSRLQREGKGVRKLLFSCHRTDRQQVSIEASTTYPSVHVAHLYYLLSLRIGSIRAEPGIELFLLDAPVVEELQQAQQEIWETTMHSGHQALAELLDRLAQRIGATHIQRFLPAAHYWPERAIVKANTLTEIPATDWQVHRPRPIQLLTVPEPISVTAPIPDYPPMLFRYRGKLHTIKKADGPERIEQEWWLQTGQHRDYYYVEDEEGQRFWLFRAGHYKGPSAGQWFIHGFFA